jgi:hypothetical protein
MNANGETTDYQLAFFTPGNLPWEAQSRNTSREIPNLRMYPLALPVI